MRAKPRLSRSVTSSTAIQLFCVLLLTVPANLLAQSGGPANRLPDASEPAKAPVGAALRVTVVDPDGKPIARQALVTLHSVFQETTNWQDTVDKSQTVFDGLLFGKYNLEASALGYLSTRSQIEIASAGNTIELKMMLQRDPVVDLEESDDSPSRQDSP